MTTPRKTRAPRKPNPFRMSAVVSCTLSTTLHDALLAINPANKSKTIRAALLKYAHKAKAIKVPDAYRPPAQFNQQVAVSLSLKPDTLRQEYEHHASILGITQSELILRCVYAYVKEAETEGETHRRNT
jgi:hypothetical protein